MTTFISYNTQKGVVAIFFAIVVAFITVTLSAGIGLIGMRELQFTALSDHSQKAFYAADAGLECAIHYDVIHSAFPTNNSGLASGSIQCFGANTTWTRIAADANAATSTFSITFPNNDRGPCATVTVAKGETTGAAIHTTIESRGVDVSTNSANDCSGGSNQNRRVERALRAEY